MLLMVGKKIRGGNCHSHSINIYANVNNKYLKIIIRIKKYYILNIEM